MNTALITPQPAQPQDGQRIHPLWLRLTHWLNALAVVILVTSGWRIYNAAPFFDFSFPGSITLGGWLGGRGQAQAGFILGIIGTVLWVLGVLFYVVLAGLAVSRQTTGLT
jgi:thiosulfate reductase cytochrome b subunit